MAKACDTGMKVGATVTVAEGDKVGSGGVGIVKKINADGTLEARRRANSTAAVDASVDGAFERAPVFLKSSCRALGERRDERENTAANCRRMHASGVLRVHRARVVVI